MGVYRNPYASPASTLRNAGRLLAAHALEVSNLLGIDQIYLTTAKPVAAGFNGVALKLPGMPPWKAILKVTTEASEVAAAARVQALGGHMNLPLVHAAVMVNAHFGVIWMDEVCAIERPSDIGMDDRAFADALNWLKALTEALSWENEAAVRNCYGQFIKAAAGSPLLPLWDLATDLFGAGVLIREGDWKKENLGLRGGCVVLLDFGAEVTSEVLEATPRAA